MFPSRSSLLRKLKLLTLEEIADFQLQSEIRLSEMLDEIETLRGRARKIGVYNIESIEDSIAKLRSESELLETLPQYRKSGFISRFFPGLNRDGIQLRYKISNWISEMSHIQRDLETLQDQQTELFEIIKECNKRIRTLIANAKISESSNRILERLRIERIERERQLLEEKKRKEQKISELKAAAASAIGRSREHAKSLKSKLVLAGGCPYCGKDLGESPEADHIYPVSKGGFSTIRNMVMVCAECNRMKGSMTLNSFISQYNLDRTAVESRLRDLEKDF